MTDPIEQINNISNVDDFLNFVIQLAKDAKEHPEEWANTTITDYLGQIASWIDDCDMFEDNINFLLVPISKFDKNKGFFIVGAVTSGAA